MNKITHLIKEFYRLAKDVREVNQKPNLRDLKENLSKKKIKENNIPTVEQEENPEKKEESTENSAISQPDGLENKDENELREKFIELADQGRYQKIKQILLDPQTSSEVKSTLITTFINDFNEEFKKTFIEENDDLPASILQELFQKSSSNVGPFQRNWRILKVIVGHKNAPIEILKLAADSDSELEPDPRVRMEAIANKNLNDSFFLKQIFQKEKNPDVKEAFLENPSTPAAIIDQVFGQFKDDKSQSYHQKVESLAKNPNTSANILIEIMIESLEHLFGDAALPVKITEKTSYLKLKKLLQSSKLLSLRKDSIPLEILTSIIRNPNLNAAKHKNLFIMFAQSSHPEIKLAVAENKNAPRQILEQLKSIPDIVVSDAAKKTLESLKNPAI